MKINKENAGWIFCSAVLFILLILSIYMGLSGWYFKNQPNFSTELVLGKTVQMSINGNSAQSLALNIDGAFLPGEKLPQIISIKNMEDEKSVYLRGKAYISVSDMQNAPLGIVPTINWTYNEEDGYYYLDHQLTAQNKVSFCSHIFTEENLILSSNQKYIISFVFETLDEEQNVTTIWGKTI